MNYPRIPKTGLKLEIPYLNFSSDQFGYFY